MLFCVSFCSEHKVMDGHAYEKTMRGEERI